MVWFGYIHGPSPVPPPQQSSTRIYLTGHRPAIQNRAAARHVQLTVNRTGSQLRSETGDRAVSLTSIRYLIRLFRFHRKKQERAGAWTERGGLNAPRPSARPPLRGGLPLLYSYLDRLIVTTHRVQS